MSRNAFEHNTPEATPEEAVKYGDKLVALLPLPDAGKHYEFVVLSCGKIGVIKEG